MKKALFFSGLLVISGCNSLPESVTYEQSSDNKKLLVDEYYIGVDDVVSVNVWKNPDLSIQVPVRPDGKISVPLAGEVIAGGRTPLDVAAEIKERLSKFIRDPQVSVILNELRSHEYLSRVRVTGAVRSPVSINFRQGMTIVDLVLAAGGVNEFASANSARLYRRINDKVENINISLDDILNSGDLETNILVQPGDILIVPERVF
jgi:polysaccharide export outer membrane protein